MRGRWGSTLGEKEVGQVGGAVVGEDWKNLKAVERAYFDLSISLSQLRVREASTVRRSNQSKPTLNIHWKD